MSKTIGLLVWSGAAFTLTKGAFAFDSSSSVTGGFDRYLETKAFNSACCAADRGSKVTGSSKNDGDNSGSLAKMIVKLSVPGFVSSSRLFSTVLLASVFGKLKSTFLLTLLLLRPLFGSGLVVKKAVGWFFSPGPTIYK